MYDRVKPPNLRGYYGQFAEDAAIQTYFINKAWDESKTYEVKTEGFYVDIGAYSPIQMSNTYWFYQHGWRGINVEPFPEVIKKFNELRPLDRNVSCAIGTKTGSNKYYSWGNSGLNTFSEKKVEEYTRKGMVTGKPAVSDIEVIRMETLFDQYLPAGTPIDFISVDVEGMDLDVLNSNNWDKYRPELVAVELDTVNIEDLLLSDLYTFMNNKGYDLYFSLAPAIIFIDARRKK